MASVIKETLIAAPAARVWDALRDFGGLKERVMRGLVTECRLDDATTRSITFSNGIEITEKLIGIDDDARRFAYTLTEGPIPTEHYSASVQVFAEADGSSRVVWITDVLPDDYADAVADVMTGAAKVMKRTLESDAEPAPSS